MRYMVGCKDGGLSFVYRYARLRSLCYRSERALARFVADSVAGDCPQRRGIFALLQLGRCLKKRLCKRFL